MKVSGFTFVRNANQLGFPFLQSIQSILPLVDEFVINVGESQDQTLSHIESLREPKIKILQSQWNTRMTQKGFVYGQQKMMAQYHCTGDWAFYLEADEIVHEQDHTKILQAMQTYLHDDRVEALVFDYLHFYGNISTIVWSPAWYRRAPRIIKTSVRSYAPDGLFWVVLDKKNKVGRYPRAALVPATIYHYGWVRPETCMQEKMSQVQSFWSAQNKQIPNINYRAIDPQTLRLFTGCHPAVLGDFFPTTPTLFSANAAHVLTKRERKNRAGLWVEKILKIDLSKKHYRLVSTL
ncbi:MAG: glycosyltransferase [Coxiella sp. RIFCSPHIGHO2_12_FULL_44_14]|nr:MAG: glycosyltransferase [Coxiella sp. RIFCSPHIGHO2_12_FULL_44_14]